MYQPYPSSAQLPDMQRPGAPATVRQAVMVMYAGAVASLALAAAQYLTRKTTRANLLAHFPKLTPHHHMLATRPLVLGALAGGVIAVVLWIVLAQSCKNGSNWARITGTVLFAIATIDALSALVLPFALAVKIIQLVVWLLGLAAVVLLWRGSSGAYFRGTPS
jgi:hypothetical protein